MNSLRDMIAVFFVIFFGGFAIFDLYHGNIGWFIYNIALFALWISLLLFYRE